MTIDTQLVDGVATISPKGSVDSSTADELDAAINQFDMNELSQITFNFSDVDYISSKGLRILIATYRKMQHKPVIVQNANEAVFDIFKISGLVDVFGLK